MTSYDSIAPEEQVDLGAELEYVRRPTFASGRVAMSNIIDSLIGAAYRKPFMVRCVQVLLMGLRANDVAGRTKPSGGITDVPRLHQIDMPPSFEGEEFARVFGLLLHYRVRRRVPPRLSRPRLTPQHAIRHSDYLRSLCTVLALLCKALYRTCIQILRQARCWSPGTKFL